MYNPKVFQISDTKTMVEVMQKYSFALLVSHQNGEFFATHLPILFDANVGESGILFGHFAKANNHWGQIDGEEVLVVFSGPHAYISPSWYTETQAVPTWNYVSVHVHGIARVVTDESRLNEILANSIHFYEPGSRLLQDLRHPFYQSLANGVVGFEIFVTRMEGKAKLSQNKSSENRLSVAAALERTGNAMDSELAGLMRLTMRDSSM